MDIREFVSTVLQEIVSGVQDAQTEIQGDGEINPHIWMAERDNASKQRILESNNGKWIHMVEFDVAVTVADSTNTKGVVGLVVGSIGLGSQGQSTNQNSTVSRVKFEVPIAFPRKQL